MTWIQFFMWSVIFYAFYFGFNILLDTRKKMRVKSDNGAEDVLHFTESQPPVVVKEEKKSQPPVIVKEEKEVQRTNVEQKEAMASTSSKPVDNTSKTVDKAIEANGVGLAGVFTLARQQAIKITNKIDFTAPSV